MTSLSVSEASDSLSDAYVRRFEAAKILSKASGGLPEVTERPQGGGRVEGG